MDSNIENELPSPESGTVSARFAVLFDDQNLQSLLGQQGSCRQPSNPCANDNHIVIAAHLIIVCVLPFLPVGMKMQANLIDAVLTTSARAVRVISAHGVNDLTRNFLQRRVFLGESKL